MNARSKNPKPPTLIRVKDKDEIRKSVLNFNSDPRSNKNRREKLLQQTSYWVFDKRNKIFGPNKFVGYKDMNYSRYESAIEGRYDGDSFKGGVAKKAIEKALGQPYLADQTLSTALVKWGTALCRPGVFDGVTTSKWSFVIL